MSEQQEYNVEITATSRSEWIKQIALLASQRITRDTVVIINIRDIQDVNELEPLHLVLLACLIESYMQQYCRGVRLTGNKSLICHIREKLKFKNYWGQSNQNYSPASDKDILNLWKINGNEIDNYSTIVHNYLRKGVLASKDLSAISNNLIEACYNIIDHAFIGTSIPQIGFIFLQYCPISTSLKVAVCDFGVGVSRRIQDYFKDKQLDDKDALLYATQDKVTTKSTSRNRGWGLQNIILSTDFFFAISNRGLVAISEGNKRAYDLPFHFQGTILFYELALSNLENEEIITNFAIQ